MSRSDRPTLRPSSIGQFFRLQSCPQYLQWEYDDQGRAKLRERDWDTKDMSPVLANEGDTFEQSQLEALASADRDFYGVEIETDLPFAGTWPDDNETGRQRLLDIATEVEASAPGAREVVIFQPHFSGTIGAYEIAGKGDLLVLESVEEGVRPTFLEVKSSSQQKVHHRYQATIYATLLQSRFESKGIAFESGMGDAPRTCIVTPDNAIESSPDDPNAFPVAPYRSKLTLKLQEGGSFDQTILETEFESTTNRIAQRCSGCEYEPMCLTRGIESNGLELLGLQAGTQESLHRLGIHDIEDFAMLFDHPSDGSVHWDYSALNPRDERLVQRVRQEADIANLQKRAQIAYRFLLELDDSYGGEWPHWFANPLRGTGNALPEDIHGEFETDWEEFAGPDYPSGSLIRVYLYVQQDHAQDRVTVLAATVECTLTDRREDVFELPTAIPTTESGKNSEEERLFSAFFEQFAAAITEVAPDWTERDEFADLDLTEDQGFLHLFLYSDDHRSALMDAIRRHEQSGWRRPLRTLLGLRAGIDQEMVSVIQNDFRNRWALRFPGLGTVQSVAHFSWDEEWFDWRQSRADGTEAPVDKIFFRGVFDSTVRYSRNGYLSVDDTDREPAWLPTDRQLKRWVYPIQNRETAQLPTEYIWGLFDRLNPDAADDPEIVEEYIYREGTSGQRIDEEDVKLGAAAFTQATRHIERSIEHTDRYAKDRFMNKDPIDISSLADLSFEPRTLDEVCVEYQQLEYHSTRETTESYYCQPLEERLDSGGSVRFECSEVDTDENIIKGYLLLSDGTQYDPHIHDGLVRGSVSVSDDDFMVMTRLDFEGERPEASRRDSPQTIRNSTTVTISDMDESTGEIILEAPFTDGWPNRGPYSVNHRGWSTDEEAIHKDWTTFVSPDEEYVLDPMFDQVIQNYAYEALQNAVDAPVRRWIRQVYSGERQRIPIDGWSEDAVVDYIDSMEENGYYRPNSEQEAFIRDTDHGIVTLQGPPGTGKTSYSVAPTVLARAHSSMTTHDPFVGVVSAVSHNAVDEALETVLKLRDECPPGDDEELELIRVCSASGQGLDDPRVTSIRYSEAETDELERLYEAYLDPDSTSDQRAVFFGPPASLRSCLNTIYREVDEAPVDRISDAMEQGITELFDLAVIDEASMMDLPLCFLVASFVCDEGQFTLVGDHRQMEPIQKHEWEEEDREPIERHNPFLSALDFLRFLRGEDVDIEYIEREPPALDEPDEAFPVYRLEETHRLPEESAALHTDLFYRQDGISLRSVGVNEHTPKIDGEIGALVDSRGSRVTLLVHDEAQSQKSNPVEQALVKEILDSLSNISQSDSTTTDDQLSTGVVVPFRAQRRDLGRVQAAVDTVERFQGGQRDLMILSMTASERGYISQISEFLLDPKRFNVGASRVKRKLIVIASAGLFEESSDDVETFERQEAWVSFLNGMGGIGGADDTVSLSELLSTRVKQEYIDPVDRFEDCNVRIFSGYDPG